MGLDVLGSSICDSSDGEIFHIDMMRYYYFRKILYICMYFWLITACFINVILLGHNDSSTINILKEAAENLSNSMNDLLMLQRIEDGTNQHFARYIITLYMRTYHTLYIYIGLHIRNY